MVGNTSTQSSNSRFGIDKQKEIAVNAEHMVHLSLSEGLDNNAPHLVIHCLKVYLKYTNKKNY